MARNEFENETRDLLNRVFPVVERYDDVAFNREFKRQVKKKPYDFFGCTLHGRFFAAEAKRVKSHLFPIRNFKDHQHEGLRQVMEHNGWPWVFINWRIRHKDFFDLGSTGVAIWVHYGVFKQKVDEVLQMGRKSLKPTDFGGKYWLERITGGWEPGPGHMYYNFVLETRNEPLDRERDWEVFEERILFGNPVQSTGA